MDQRCAYTHTKKKVSRSETKNAYYSSLMRIYSFSWDFRGSRLTKARETDSRTMCAEEKTFSVRYKRNAGNEFVMGQPEFRHTEDINIKNAA